jgi:hypothetical protein
MTFNIGILMNAGCTLDEIIEIIPARGGMIHLLDHRAPYDCKVITFIYNNDTLVITDN